jgi:hypothetical protein
MTANLQGSHACTNVPHAALLLILAFCLSACGGGGSGGVDLAEGQGPDPVVLYVPIAYVKRPVPLDDNGDLRTSDIRELTTFDIGADLFIRDRASPSADERNVTGDLTEGLGDVRDLEVSFDGAKVLFAMRAQFIEDAPEEDQPTWNIWEYDFENDLLHRIIASEITAEAGHDIAPLYLPDGRIVFSSTRQRQASAILLDEGKPQFPALDEDFDEPAYVLHVMNEDGSDIQQVSFNQSHDLDPTVLSDGRVAFVRWDNMGAQNAMHLYAMNPDGTGLELLYGKNSHDTGTDDATIQFTQPRETEDGYLMTIVRGFTSDAHGGDIVLIDVENFVDNTQATAENQGLVAGPAQSFATINDVRTNGEVSPGGVFGSAFPVWDGTDRLFVSWSQCRLVEIVDPIELTERIVPCTADRLADPSFSPADPLFGLWIYDRANDTQLPVLQPEEGIMFTDVVAAQDRSLPPVIYDKDSTGELDPGLLDANVGLLNIRSVYDIDGVDTVNIPVVANPALVTAAQRPARFLRIVKAVSIPDDDVYDIAATAFGRIRALGMREIIGYVPIEPDGSVVTRVPANVALSISVLDETGRRISPRHESWLQVRPGEELHCNGCHENGTGTSHGRSDAFDSAYAGATITGSPFPNTVAAIFADLGETMAEARARISCATDCAATIPSVDIIYRDVWTDASAAGRAPDAPLDYLYDDLETPAPVISTCWQTWTPACRIVINYETIIHPLWGAPRLAPDGLTDLSCTLCHNTQSVLLQLQEPAGQLDLTDGPSTDQPDHFRSYRELLFSDNEQVVDMGALQDRLVEVGIDPITGDPIFETINVPPSMSANGAVNSPRFFDRFAPGGPHDGYLSVAEIKLIAEWLDIGGQYFNNPFDAPQN